tara:strand:- start:199 stop:798 length:600 start_codon:yes stop_codon:yes gene_type:complete
MSNASNSVTTQSPSAKDVKDNTLKAANPKAVATGKAVAKLEVKHFSDRLKMFERFHGEIKCFKNDYKGYTDFRLTFSMAYSDAKGVKVDSGRKTFDRWIKDMMAETSDNGNQMFKFEIPIRPIKPESEIKNEKRAEAKAEDTDGSVAKANEQTSALRKFRDDRDTLTKRITKHVTNATKNGSKPRQAILDKMLALSEKL